MRIAVVIPAFDEQERIAAAVASARRAADREFVEIVVVDGGSRDATAERARSAGARVVSSERGRARQLQAGVLNSEAPVVLFLHADSELTEGYSKAVRRAMQDPETLGGAFALAFDDPSRALRVVEWGVRLRLALFRLPFGDQGLFVRRDALLSMGGVPQLPLMEDVDLVRAIKRRGRLALLEIPVITSARRYRENGVLRTVLQHAAVLLADRAGVPRERIAHWLSR